AGYDFQPTTRLRGNDRRQLPIRQGLPHKGVRSLKTGRLDNHGTVEDLARVGFAIPAIAGAIIWILILAANDFRIVLTIADAVRPGIVHQQAKICAEPALCADEQSVVVRITAVIKPRQTADQRAFSRVQPGKDAPRLNVPNCRTWS